MKSLKRIIIILTALLTITVGLPAAAASGEETEGLCGMLPIEEEELSPEEIAELCVPAAFPANAGMYSEGSEFPVNEMYVSQLSGYELSLYKRICAEYEGLYRSAADAPKQRFVTLTYDDSLISRTELKKIYFIFYYTNPQYFYAYNGYSVGTSDNGQAIIALKLYTDFMDGDTRCAVRDGIEKKAAEWLSEAEGLSSDLDKEMLIAEKLCGSVQYKTGSRFSQSLAGAMYYGECVCNGYAMAVNYLCNLAGIDTFTVVSRDHAWNAVDLYGTYFQLDTTWMDSTSSPLRWVNKSTATFMAQDKGSSHTIDLSCFPGITLPEMTRDNTDDYIFLTAENFPDDTLRNELAAMFDSDGSGGLCLNEYAYAENTDLSARNIGDLSGINAIPSLRRLECSFNPIFMADISGTPLTDGSFECSGSTVTVSAENEEETAVPVPPSFDFSKALGWKGGYPDEVSRLIRAQSGRVSYEYDCGGGIVRSFNVRICTDGDPLHSLAQGISYGFAQGDTGAAEDIYARLSSGEGVYDVIMDCIDSQTPRKEGRKFIEELYLSLLGRFPDKEGLGYWENRFAAGCSRGYILRGFLCSREFGGIAAECGGLHIFGSSDPNGGRSSEEFVSEVYRGFLRRLPSQSELSLYSGSSAETAVMDVLRSEEYSASPLSAEDFTETLYIVLLNRDPDSEGLLHWREIISQAGAEGTAEMFMLSEEFGRVRPE